MAFELTAKQNEALKLFKTEARYILFQGGSRSGKTVLAIYICLFYAMNFPNSNVLLARLYLSEVKASLIYQTLFTLLKMINPELLKYVLGNMNKSERYIRFWNGSHIWYDGISSNEMKSEKVLGREYNLIYISEITQIDYEIYSMLASRLNSPPAQKGEYKYKRRILMDCNPTSKRHWAYQLFVAGRDPETHDPVRKRDYAYITMNPLDNPNLDEDYLDNLRGMSKRQQRRFLLGKWLEDIEGACWNQRLIDKSRITKSEAPLYYEKTYIGVDPALTATAKSDETGIVVCGKHLGDGYVLEDASGKYTPNQWAEKVIELWHKYEATRVVCETNQGGDIVLEQIRNLDESVRVVGRKTQRGKVIRADPIVALYEQARVHHVGYLNKLEDQMTEWTEDAAYSPDRMDALIYCLTDLFNRKAVPKIHKYSYNEPN